MFGTRISCEDFRNCLIQPRFVETAYEKTKLRAGFVTGQDFIHA